MSSNFSKINDGQRVEEPLYVVLFVSRNKDNKNVEGFTERKEAMLWHLPFNNNGILDFINHEAELPEKLLEKFNWFTKEGKEEETTRLYISVNARDPEKVKNQLMHRLIDDNLQTRMPLTHMDAVMAAIAAKAECKATRMWLFDVDTKDEKFVNAFLEFIKSELDIKAEKYKTPHGYAVVTERGFDLRVLKNFSMYETYKEYVDMKRDDMLCAYWTQNK